jgi:hypothetical protein
VTWWKNPDPGYVLILSVMFAAAAVTVALVMLRVI